MLKYLILFGTLYMFCSCKVLSKSQNDDVQSLAKGITTTVTLPSEFVRQYYEVVFQVDQMRIAMVREPTPKIEFLEQNLIHRATADSVIRGYTSGYGILNAYAELLMALTDTGYLKNLNKQKDGFITNFDTLVSRYNSVAPAHLLPIKSLDRMVSTVISEIGSWRFRHLQRKYLISVVDSADPAVADICDHYSAVDFYKNTAQIVTLDLDQVYRTFLIDLRSDSAHGDTYSYFKIYDPLFLDWKNKEAALAQFNDKTQKAIVNLKTAHHKLKLTLAKKAKWKETIRNLRELYASVNSLKESYQKFHKDLTPLKVDHETQPL